MERTTRWIGRAVLMGVLVALTACGLPRSGPTRGQILAGSVERAGDAYIVPVDNRIAQVTEVPAGTGFSSAFEGAGTIGSDTIRPGDVLDITIWENVDQGILSGIGGNVSTIDRVQVDGAGFIFVPYAGRLRAADNTPESLRQLITRQLESQTPDPQVLVRRAAGDGATVSVIGSVGGQGVYPIERPTRTLTAMLARAGGVTIEPAIARVTVIRANRRGSIWLPELYADPGNDIALRPDDRILVEEDARSYTAIGATGGQRRMPFEAQSLTAIEALGQVGGLNANLADPKGIFVFRDEEEAIARRVLNRTDLSGNQRIVYVLDLTEPTGVFLARDFAIRDGDTVYVTEAPFVQWQKSISALTGSVGAANSISTAAGN